MNPEPLMFKCKPPFTPQSHTRDAQAPFFAVHTLVSTIAHCIITKHMFIICFHYHFQILILLRFDRGSSNTRNGDSEVWFGRLMYKADVSSLSSNPQKDVKVSVFPQGEQNRRILSYISDSFTSSKNKRVAAELETNLKLFQTQFTASLGC